MLSKYQIVFGLMLAFASLISGEFVISSERAVIAAQRFVPDTAHTVPLTLKGKIFYVNSNERDEYYLYHYLFMGMFILMCVVGVANFVAKNRSKQ